MATPMTREALIVDGVRSPRGRGRENGALHSFHPQNLLARVLKALESRVGFDPADIDDVITGTIAAGPEHAGDIGRMAVLAAGWPVSVPGVSIHRYCGSGQQALSFAALGVLSGQQDAVIASGVEVMSRGVGGPTPTSSLDGMNPELRAKYPIVPPGIAADIIASLEGFTREEVDAFAARSQERAAVAIEEGRFRSIVPIHHDDGTLALDRDEHPRPGTTMEDLAKLRPSFTELGAARLDGYDTSFDEMALATYPHLDAIDHVHHAGNSSGIVDGASAIFVCSPDFARAHGLTPRARVVMTALAGDDPVVMLTAPAPASRKALAKAGMTVDDIDLWEINEAFSSVVLKAMRELDLDPDNVNVNGGAIALGHPIGASGPMLVQTALDELERQGKPTALITMCTGGGMATATIIERV